MIPDVTPNGVFYLLPTGWLTSFYNPPIIFFLGSFHNSNEALSLGLVWYNMVLIRYERERRSFNGIYCNAGGIIASNPISSASLSTGRNCRGYLAGPGLDYFRSSVIELGPPQFNDERVSRNWGNYSNVHCRLGK